MATRIYCVAGRFYSFSERSEHTIAGWPCATVCCMLYAVDVYGLLIYCVIEEKLIFVKASTL